VGPAPEIKNGFHRRVYASWQIELSLGRLIGVEDMEIFDKNGRLIVTSNPPDKRIFDNMVIRDALLAGRELEGISFDGSDLQGSDFSGADLYGAFLCDSKFDSCLFVQADLRSAFMFRVSFRNADMRGARFSLNQMGGALFLRAVDFSNANLEEADFTGALYDSDTIFPNGFNPEERGLKLTT
jgi:uncharacterized protein YjbI with pentapeptide repeats